MPKQSVFFCLAALLLLQTSSGYADTLPAEAIADPALAARIDAAIAPRYKPGEPGAVIIVIKDGKPILRKAYGMADVAKQIPMTPETTLRTGSLTKQFTSTAIMMLADEGKLSVDDDITKYLPDYPTRGKKITIEHLLTHTSGIVNFLSKPEQRAMMAKDMTIAQMIDFFKDDPLDFEPGSSARYNNSGYFLLGAIIEKLSGMPYARFVEQRIFVPLGMNDTAYEGYERRPAPRAAGHTGTAGRFTPSAPLSMTQPFSAGAVVSTIDDMARWDAAVSSGKLLKAASWQRAFTPFRLTSGAPNNYGYAWGIYTFKGTRMVFNLGGINGFRSGTLRLPDEKVSVIVLSNSESGVEVVVRTAAALAIGQPYRTFTPVALEPKALEAFAGVYKVDDKASRTFWTEGGQLMMRYVGRRNIALQPFSERGFFDPNSLDYMEFGRDTKGEVVEVTYHQDDKETVHPRTAAIAPR